MNYLLILIIVLLLIFYNSKVKRLHNTIAELLPLLKFKDIPEAEINANKIIEDSKKSAFQVIEEAKKKSKEIDDNAEKIIENSKKSAFQVIEEAKEKSKEINDMAEFLLNGSQLQAKNIIENANNEARKVYFDAESHLNLINNKINESENIIDKKSRQIRQLEQVVQSLKNIVDGYGDKYIIPTYNLIDNLAEHFGYTEAGQELMKAREYSRQMVKDGNAANCDYVENNRKDIAIKFVLDAFNGKVDSIMTKIKLDNYGTLEKQINDAYFLVNNNGSAFRNAKINEEYLIARISELRWAVIVNELKIKEKEEQKRIQEQIREEERAQKEFERAIKESAREEETLHKMMEKIKNEVEKATAEQKQKYENQLKELEIQLKAAEEKNQRAISMAQQTKAGHVYIISNIGSFGEDIYKIGLTRRLEPIDRVKELGDASVPFSFDIHAMIYCENAPILENNLHKLFLKRQVNKINSRKEFFKVSLSEIRLEIEKMNINVSWTMVAEAREYKETLSIERAIKNKEFNETEWESNQLKSHSIELEGLD